MHAFEHLMADLFRAEGFWTFNGFRVGLTKEDKIAIDRPSSPNWEIDLLAYSGNRNELLVIECKSYLDSRGVCYADFCEKDDRKKDVYKLFNETLLRELVLKRLQEQLEPRGLIPKGTRLQLCLAAAKIRGADEAPLARHFEERGWKLFGPSWIRERLMELSSDGYQDQLSSILTKILVPVTTE